MHKKGHSLGNIVNTLSVSTSKTLRIFYGTHIIENYYFLIIFKYTVKSYFRRERF